MMSGLVARQAGLTARDTHAELVANLVPQARMAPAGVIAVVRAQEFVVRILYSAA
jgi:3,4-dihydroxy-2-butanone 4-phosphate synthase